jgi:hypothetical protein
MIEWMSVTLLPTGRTYGVADEDGPVTIEVWARAAAEAMRAADEPSASVMRVM